jgi:hypothetical protein
LSRPATRVMGSPMIGIQESRSDQTPYRLNHAAARSNVVGLAGNQGRSFHRRQNRPKSQFTTEPSVFPVLATTKSQPLSNSPVAASPVRTTSEDAGKKVAQDDLRGCREKSRGKKCAYKQTDVARRDH